MTKDKSGLTPFEYAVMKRDKETVMILLKEGANLKRRGEEGRTALATAARLRDLEMIIALLQLGADVNTRDKYGQIPLHLAT